MVYIIEKCANSLTLFVLVFSPVDNGAVGFVVAAVAVVRPIQCDTGQYANLAANVTTHPSDNLPIRWYPALYLPSMPNISSAVQRMTFPPRYLPLKRKKKIMLTPFQGIIFKNFYVLLVQCAEFCMCYTVLQHNEVGPLAYEDAVNHNYCIYISKQMIGK